MTDPIKHKYFLEYREKHVYFGGKTKLIDFATFSTLDTEFRELQAKGDTRTDEEEARYWDLAKILFRD